MMRAQAFVLAVLASFWAASAVECWEDPEIDLCDDQQDLNNGVWPLHDINWYRRKYTKGNKANLNELMSMNETNETELMLVTPLTEHPTPMPPTPAPTPIPQDVNTDISMGAVTSAAAFAANKAAVIQAWGFAPGDAAVEYAVETETVMEPPPTEDQAKAAGAVLTSIAAANIDATITVNNYRRLEDGRRAQATSATVKVVAKTTDPAAADAAKTAVQSGGSAAIVASFQAVDSSQFANAVATEPTVQTVPTITVTQVAADPVEAAKIEAAAEQRVADNKVAAASAAGVDSANIQSNTAVEQVPTPLPTKVPTAVPTSLPAGFTNGPTHMPTFQPSKSPTRMPTKMPTAVPTATPTKAPTATPTATPTKSPTATPTAAPTKSPTASPTKSPTTSAPTPVPPTSAPTMSPTNATEEESGAHKTAGFITAAVLASFVAAQ